MSLLYRLWINELETEPFSFGQLQYLEREGKIVDGIPARREDDSTWSTWGDLKKRDRSDRVDRLSAEYGTAKSAGNIALHDPTLEHFRSKSNYPILRTLLVVLFVISELGLIVSAMAALAAGGDWGWLIAGAIFILGLLGAVIWFLLCQAFLDIADNSFKR